MNNSYIVILAIIAFAFYVALHKSQSNETPGAGKASGGSVDEPSQPATPEIIPIAKPDRGVMPVSRPGGQSYISDPVASFREYHKGIISTEIKRR